MSVCLCIRSACDTIRGGGGTDLPQTQAESDSSRAELRESRDLAHDCQSRKLYVPASHTRVLLLFALCQKCCRRRGLAEMKPTTLTTRTDEWSSLLSAPSRDDAGKEAARSLSESLALALIEPGVLGPRLRRRERERGPRPKARVRDGETGAIAGEATGG